MLGLLRQHKFYSAKGSYMKKTMLAFFILAACLITMAGPASAQNKTIESSGWEFTVTPLMSTVSVDGTIGVSHRSAHINVPWSKLQHYVESGYALNLEARNDRHAFFFSGSYLKLGDDGTLSEPVSAYADVDLQITNFEADYSYRLNDSKKYPLEAFGGVRYWRFKTDIDAAVFVPGYQLSFSDTEQWVDPVVGLQFRPALTKRLSLLLRGDVGGFGLGSQFTWKGLGAINYQFTTHVGGQVGYSYTSINYSKSGCKIDIDMQGAFAGMNFRF